MSDLANDVIPDFTKDPPTGLSPDAARAQLEQLKADPNFGKKVIAGDEHATRWKSSLIGQIVAPAEQAIAAQVASDRQTDIEGFIAAAGITGDVADELRAFKPATKADYDFAVQWRRDQMSNPVWRQAYLDGDTIARRKMATANSIIARGHE